jgi:hypothetical protein
LMINECEMCLISFCVNSGICHVCLSMWDVEFGVCLLDPRATCGTNLC